MTETVTTLQRIAVAGAILVGGVMAWEHVSNSDPADATHRAASDAFDDGDWDRAYLLFSEIVAHDAGNLAARRGQANSLVQLARYEEAHDIMNGVVADDGGDACNLATRGIIADHLGRHAAAMRDYERAVAGCRAAVHGMSWLQRLLTNTHEQPPTVAARLAYLRSQMELPADKRVLRIDEMDRAQKPWTS